MHPDPNDVSLLLVHADSHRPALAQGPGVQTASNQHAQATKGPDHLWDAGADPNDLRVQRWGVIAPAGPDGDRLLGAIAPLVERRRAQQDGKPVKVYRVPPRMTQSEAARWKKGAFDTSESFRDDLPRYQLILGDLDQVPLALQQIQSVDGAVGRLAFEAEQDYAAYVDKLLRWEHRPAPERQARALLHSVRDGTRATEIGRAALMEPGLELLERSLASGSLAAREVKDITGERGPSPDQLVQELGQAAADVLFTLSHGEGPPRRGWKSRDEQRAAQGAMSFGDQGRLRGEDVARGPFLPGGLWFMLACFGAGTPDESSYLSWLQELKASRAYGGDIEGLSRGLSPDRPFVAALPKAVLKNPDGPLAFIGHVDLAWTYGFQDLDAGVTNRPARFMSILRSALKKDRLGIALRELYRFFSDANAELTALQDEEAAAAARRQPIPADPVRKGHLWMLRQDLAAYVLLGDPAVRLPLAEAAKAPAPDVAALFSQPPPPAAPASTAAPPPKLPLDIDTLEEAIGHMLAGERTVKSIAEEYGVDRGELSRLYEVYQAAGRRALTGRAR